MIPDNLNLFLNYFNTGCLIWRFYSLDILLLCLIVIEIIIPKNEKNKIIIKDFELISEMPTLRINCLS